MLIIVILMAATVVLEAILPIVLSIVIMIPGIILFVVNSAIAVNQDRVVGGAELGENDRVSFA